MNEKLLQFIWQFRHFSQAGLCVESGEQLQIIFPGQLNNNQGPDFLNAKIRIDQTLWVGHIEIHLKASDWHKHVHDEDRNYDNVILHVVLENDLGQTSSRIPLVELNQRIPRLLLERCEEWMHSQAFIPCSKNISQVGTFVWESWMQRLITERLIRKSEDLHRSLMGKQYHWEEIFWWRVAYNFGIRVNGAAFEAIAKSLSINLLAKHKSQLLHLEAMLLGQAGLLEKNFADDYPLNLKKEYQFLKNKYQLKSIFQPVYFLRMRPGSFPTIRLSQLAALIHRSSHLFSVIRETDSIQDLKSLLNVRASEYWNRHYIFDEESAFRIKSLGSQMIENLLINTIVPVLFCYGWLQRDPSIQERSIHLLTEIPSEKNSIIYGWQEIGVMMSNAYHSQSLLELKAWYCDHKKCLSCAVGNDLLKRYL